MAGLKFLYKLMILALALVASASISNAQNAQPSDASEAHRIVSLSPSITEVLFVLGAGDQVVGVTPFCDFPEQAKGLTQVGGFYDPNIEVITSLRPSLIIVPGEHSILKKDLSLGNARILKVKQETIAEDKESILIIGKAIGRAEKAKFVVRDITDRLRMTADKYRVSSSPKVLVVVGGHTSLEAVHVAGEQTFYNELIGLLGADNAYSGPVEFPKISAESLLLLNPDIIIDLIPDENPENNIKKNKILKIWQTLPKLKAVESNKVFVWGEEYLVNPGPRVPMILEKFAKAFND